MKTAGCRFLRRGALALVVAMLIAAPAMAGGTTYQISQFGITWTFGQAVEYGQFANGDYWVVGPAQITAISPGCTVVSGRTSNGSMVNPGLGMTQGYDSAMYDVYGPAYSDTLNVGLGISPSTPLVVPAGSSLISSISIATAGNRPQLRSAAVLTVLASAAPEGSFRPPYFGADKTIRYNVSQMDMGRLPNLTKPTGAPTITTTSAKLERPWLEHVLSWTGRYCHPSENMPDYGRDMALVIGDASLELLLDYPEDQKRTLAIRLVQYGIDLYAIASAGGVWEDLGGHMHGRKLPILLAGRLLGDAGMLSIGTTMPLRFQEDRQTWYVVQSDVGRPLYTADGRPREQYIQADVGIPEWGEQHTRQPNRDGRNWDAYYRRIVGYSILAHVLAARCMGLNELWNWDALFDYGDRYWSIERDVYSSGGANITTFHKNMWLLYRDYTPAGFNLAACSASAGHGAAGTVAVPIFDGAAAPHADIRQIAMVFDDQIDPATVGAGAVTIVGQRGGDVSALVQSATLDAAGTTLTLSFSSALPDGDRYTLTVTPGVRSVIGQPMTGPASLDFAVLAGDVDASGSVTAADLVAVRDAIGQAVTSQTAALDVDGSGDITAADLRAVRGRFGRSLP